MRQLKLDDFASDQYAIFKDIAVKKITPAVRGTTGNGTIANPPDQVSDVTLHQLVDFVKQHFKENKNFTENVADVFEKKDLIMLILLHWEKEILKERN